jgi:protein gp37
MGHPAYLETTKKIKGKAVWTGKLRINESAIDTPLRWRSPRKVFVNSMSDLFQDGIPSDIIAKIWTVMEATPQHTFQILTKRPENMLRIVMSEKLSILPNVWLGTSVESEKYKKRIDHLRLVPAAVRFISFEPLIKSVGKLDLEGIHWAIVGGESGPKARPMAQEWVREIQAQCRKQRVAFFFKQWGGVNKKKTGRLFRGRTWDEYPLSHEVAAE